MFDQQPPEAQIASAATHSPATHVSEQPVLAHDPLVARVSGSGVAAGAHATVLNRFATTRPTYTGSLARQLQRRYGNQYMQRVADLARQADGGAAFEAGADVETAIQSARGSGRPIDGSARIQMESAFGTDFSAVRVHTGTQSDTLNQALSARAFTTGQDIFFRDGEYNPSSSDGRELLAHELTHVVQQTGTVQTKLMVGAPNDVYEQEADQVARAVMQHQGAPAAVQRKCEECEREAEGGAAVGDVDQRESVGGAARSTPARLQRLCSHCAQEREQDAGAGGASILAQPRGGIQRRLARSLGSTSAQVQRDLAVPAPNPNAVAATLTDAEMQAALRYNRMRFHDPYTVAVIRDVIGITRFPGVADEEFAQAIAQWQADHNLTVDGQAGPATTRTIVGEVTAEGNARDARLIRADNFVSWRSVNGPVRRLCSLAVHAFQWDVDFATSLRNGWIIQRLDNTWNVTNCDGTANHAAAVTAQYWEAWWVDAAGEIWIPTALTTPPTTATPATADDLWRRRMDPNTRGTWSMRARLYTTLTLPAGFAIHGVPDAVDLPSTVGPVDGDALGPAVASRGQAGTWNCCDPDPALHFHRAT